MLYYANHLPIVPTWLPVIWPTGVYKIYFAVYADKLKEDFIMNVTVIAAVTNNMISVW